jgi:hypothetical protein
MANVGYSWIGKPTSAINLASWGWVWIYARMHVLCMYVSMHVCLYALMMSVFLCLYARVFLRLYLCMCYCVCARVFASAYACAYVHKDVYMNVRTYVCMFVRIHIIAYYEPTHVSEFYYYYYYYYYYVISLYLHCLWNRLLRHDVKEKSLNSNTLKLWAVKYLIMQTNYHNCSVTSFLGSVILSNTN